MDRLLQVSFFHQYFDNGLLQHARVAPDDLTARLIKRLGLKFTYSGSTLSLFQMVEKNTANLVHYMRSLLSELPIRFNLSVAPAHFYWISDLPLNWKGRMTYDSRNTVLESGNIVMRSTLKKLEYFPPSIASVSMYLDDLIAAKEANKSFFVKFKARSIGWRYCVFNKSGQTLLDPLVTDDQGVEFENLGKIDIGGVEQPLLFSSGKLILPIQQTAKRTFGLFDRTKTKPNRRQSIKELIKELPVPDPGQMSLLPEYERTHVYANMFVYL